MVDLNTLVDTPTIPFSLVPQPQETVVEDGTSFDLSPVDQTEQFTEMPSVGIDEARIKAAEISFALGEDHVLDTSTITNLLENGQEEPIRDAFIKKNKEELVETRSSMIEDFFAGRENIDAPLSTEESASLTALFGFEVNLDPNTVVEENLAASYIHGGLALAAEEDGALAKAMAQPNSELIVEGGIKLVETLKLIRKQIDINFQREHSVGKTAQDLAELLFIPLQEAYDISQIPNDVDIELPPQSIFGLGKNLLEVSKAFYKLPTEEQARLLPLIDEALTKRSRFSSGFFLQKLLLYTLDDERFENVITGADTLAGLTTLGQAAVITKGAVLLGALKFLITGSIRRRINFSSVMDHTGSVPSAALMKAKRKLIQMATNAPETRDIKTAMADAPTLYNIPGFMSHSNTSVSSLTASRITSMMRVVSGKFQTALTDLLNVKRLDDGDLNAILPIAKEQALRTYTRLEDKIIDVALVPSDKTLTKNIVARTTIGDFNNEFFLDVEEAATYIGLYGLPANTPIKPVAGGKFAIVLDNTLDESDPFIKSLQLLAREITPETESVVQARINRFRTSLDTLSESANEARLISTVGSSALRGLFSVADDIFTVMPRKSRNRLAGFLNKEQQHINSNGEQGRFAKNIGDFFDQWRGQFDASPTEKEIAGYVAYRQLNDLDLMIRNLSVLGAKARTGLKDVSVPLPGNRGALMVEASPQNIDVVKDGKDSAGILVMRANGQYEYIETIGAAELDHAKKTLNRPGNQLFMVSEKGQGALSELAGVKRVAGSAPIDFIITKGAKVGPLSSKQLVTTEGGHLISKGKHFVVQPKRYIQRDAEGRLIATQYTGDVAIFGVNTKAEAIKYQHAFDKARILLKQATKSTGSGVSFDPAKLATLGRFLKGNLPYKVKGFAKLFKQINPDEGSLSLNMPILRTTFGDSSAQSNKLADLREFTKFRDRTQSPYNPYSEIDTNFIAERSKPLMTVVEKGTKQNPILSLQRAPNVDAIPALESGLHSLINSAFLSDYKSLTANNFVKQFGDLLTSTSLNNNPLHHLFSPQFRKGADEARVVTAKNYVASAKQFLNQPNETDKAISRMQSNLADSIYRNVGQKGVVGTAKYLAAIKEPTAFVRAAAFHLTLGMLNPVQLFVQSTTFTSMAALSGVRNTLASMPAAYMMQIGEHTIQPKIRARLAKLSGWKKQHYDEADDLGRTSGFFRLGREQAYLDTAFNPKMFTTKSGRFLDGAAFFFNSIERYLRHSSMASAYRKWRTANPKARFTDQAKRQVLVEAGRLNVDMTANANANWQKGWPSPMTQFWAYPTRMAEQMVGKRLSKEDKLRMTYTYSTLFGFPTVGGIVSTFPVSDMLRDYRAKRGETIDDLAMETFEKGFLNVASRWITDTEFDIKSRLSPEGMSLGQALVEMYNADKGVLETVAGFSGNKIGETFNVLSTPIVRIFTSLAGDSGRPTPILTESEMRAIIGLPSSGRNFQIAVDAILYNTYFTKAGKPVGRITPAEGITTALIGALPARLTSVYSAKNAAKAMQDRKKNIRKTIVKEWRSLSRAIDLNDTSAADRSALAIQTWYQLGQFTPAEKTSIRDTVVKENRGMAHNLQHDFVTGMQDRMDARLDFLINIEEAEKREAP